jgi:rhodanese-related sulfurtransferase
VTKREFKDKIYRDLASISKALANSHRLEIIELLAQGEFSVEQIATQTELSIANASQHLQVLKASHLVEITRKGTSIFYRLSSPNVFKTWKALRELGVERIASVEKTVNEFRASKGDHETVSIQNLLKHLKGGRLTVLDVRPEDEYKRGHIVNAVSIPIGQLSSRFKELPKRNEVVAYCRGPFCVFADEAVVLLNKAGYKAKRLEEGFPDWALLGLPIQQN